jgi:uncharacterized protein (TIGR00255 family)
MFYNEESLYLIGGVNMLKSMTGFGRCEVSDDMYKISVEIKAVNHRYLDLGIKMPKKFNSFEAEIRSILKQDIQRGKVDLFITCEAFTESNTNLRYNTSIAKEYMDIFDQISEQFGIENDVQVSVLARFPEVIVAETGEEDEEHMRGLLETALAGAVLKFVEQRISEGEQLMLDLCSKLDNMLLCVSFIEERSPEITKEYSEKLEERVRTLLEDIAIDESRLITEVALFADKSCVDEELVRLRTHIKSMRDELTSGGCMGRKLDFIAQEMNREANTILSKSSDMEVSAKAIELKTDIEKIREQIQNIE